VSLSHVPHPSNGHTITDHVAGNALVNVLKRTVLPTYGTRDYRGGWRIGIEISPSQVSVVHKKRELSEAGKFSFTWELRLVLDRTNFTRLIRVCHPDL
jgi:hypothetical protein